jgi:hypothetical protein
MMEKFFGEARRLLVLGERLDAVTRDAQRALEMALDNREGIVRLETTIEIWSRIAACRHHDRHHPHRHRRLDL